MNKWFLSAKNTNIKDATEMRSQPLMFAYLAFLFFLIPLVLFPQTNCKLKKTDRQISVFTCQRSDSDLNSVKATFEMNVPASQYASIMLDIDSYKEWNKEISNPRVIRHIKERELIYYFEVDAPWPVKDRYCVLRLKVEQDPLSNIMYITQDLVPEMMPEKSGFVRIEEFHSELKIFPGSAKRNGCEFLLIIDPGGSIPAWLTNMVTTSMPINTYSNIFSRARELDAINEGN